jgi:hypothetical protein
VLGGKADHITLNGIDRWIGGVHLLGHRCVGDGTSASGGSFLNANKLQTEFFRFSTPSKWPLILLVYRGKSQTKSEQSG